MPVFHGGVFLNRLLIFVTGNPGALAGGALTGGGFAGPGMGAGLAVLGGLQERACASSGPSLRGSGLCSQGRSTDVGGDRRPAAYLLLMQFLMSTNCPRASHESENSTSGSRCPWSPSALQQSCQGEFDLL